MRLAAMSLLALSLFAGQLAAQSSPATAADSSASTPAFAPSHMAAARGLLAAMRFEQAAVAAAMMSFDQQAAADPETGIFRDLVEEWMYEVFTSEEAKDAFAGAYAESFSEGELEELTVFYRTPLGSRVADLQAALAAKGAEIGQRLASAREADLEERIMERAAALDATSTIE